MQHADGSHSSYIFAFSARDFCNLLWQGQRNRGAACAHWRVWMLRAREPEHALPRILWKCRAEEQ